MDTNVYWDKNMSIYCHKFNYKIQVAKNKFHDSLYDSWCINILAEILLRIITLLLKPEKEIMPLHPHRVCSMYVLNNILNYVK